MDKLTSNIGDAENTERTRLDDTALVGQEGGSTRSWHVLRLNASSAVGHVATGVVVGVTRGLLVRL